MSKGLSSLLRHRQPAVAPSNNGVPHEPVEGETRRGFMNKVGMVAVGATMGLPIAMSLRSLVPNMLYERPLRAKLGTPEQYTDGGTFLAQERIFIVRDGKTFHCISARCTHLGCTVQLAKLEGKPKGQDFEFRCPCHGSMYHADGVNYAGPAPKPLDYFKLELAADDGQLIVDMGQKVDRGWRFTV